MDDASEVAGVREAPADAKGLVRALGPGLIISASIVGSGELIVTTKLGAETGFALLWFILAGCFLKVFLQIEWGRYVLGTGRSTLQALQRIPGPRWGFSWVNWCWLAMFVATFFQVAGMLGGASSLFVEMGAAGNALGWAALITLSCVILLVMGRYGLIEKVATVMVAGFTLFTMASVLGLGTTAFAISSTDLAEGFRFSFPDELAVAFAAFGVIGVGASELLYYPYWCLEKGYARSLGRFEPGEDWERRARGWLRVLQWDAWVSAAIYTLSTVAFYLLGAAILHRQGLLVENEAMIPTLARLYTEVFGDWAYWVFGVGAFAVLFSTIFIATASNTRLVADAAGILGNARGGGARLRWIKAAAIVLPLLYFVLNQAVAAPVSMVILGSVAQGAMLPFLAWALWFLQKEIPETLRGGRFWLCALALSTAACSLLGGWQLWRVLGGS